MARTVSYSVVPRKNPSDPESAPRYYAQAQAGGDVTIREMAERIQKSCTVTRADTMAVLTALEDTITEGLQAGEIVRIGDIGSLQIGLSGKGVDVEKDYDVSMIRKARINFRPGIALSGMLTTLAFTKVDKLPKKTGAGNQPETPKA